MVERSQIRPQMEILDSAGERVGVVDAVDGERVRLANSSPDTGQHHHVDLADVARVDDRVHLSRTRAALGIAAATGASTSASDTKSAIPLPPIRNPAVDGAAPRRNYMLPWVLAGLTLLILILALSQCDHDESATRTTSAQRQAGNSAIVVPRVAGAPLSPGTLAFDLDRFMSGTDGVPRTFTFDGVNFGSGTANLRPGDSGDLDDVARVLAAYPTARAAVVGYADAVGNSRFNRDLGSNRARAVIQALQMRGVPAARLTARSGGEDAAVATNSSSGGRIENRRTELVILKR